MNLYQFYEMCHAQEIFDVDKMADKAKQTYSKNTIARFGGIKRMKSEYMAFLLAWLKSQK